MQSIIDELLEANTLEVPLRQMLQQCCERVLARLQVSIAGVWVLDPRENVVELQACAGPDARLHEGHARVRLGAFKIGRIATAHLPHLTNSLLDDPSLSNREWAQRERLTAFAGLPLMFKKRCLGVVAVFSRTPISHDVIEQLTHVGPALARVIHEHGVPSAPPSSESGVRQAALKSDERFHFLGDSVPHQVWTADTDGQLTYVNKRVLDYFGRTEAQMLGSGWLDMLHPDDVAECTRRWGVSLGTGEPYEFEFRLWSVQANAYRWHEARALPQRNAKGELIQWYGANTDVDARRRSEDRHRLLLEAGRRLSSSLDAPHILADIAALLVPHLADWCFIDLQRLDGTTDRALVTHANPLRAELAKRFYQWSDSIKETTHPAHGVLKGTSRYIEELTNAHLDAAAINAEHRQAMREMGPSSMVVVPLRAIERTVGLLSLVTSVDSGRRLTPEDLALIEEIASRAAMALENARYISELRAAFAQRERALADAEFERRTLQRIFEQAPAAICILRGPKQVVETANARFLELIGNRAVVGRTFAEAMPELVAQSDLLEKLHQAFTSGVAFLGHEVTVKVDRAGTGALTEGVYDFVYQPLVDELGSVQGIMIFTVEVTQEVAARKEREAMIATLAQANSELDEFASVASHDLKAPLRGIASLANWLAESLAPKANDEERQQLELIQSRARRLGALVDGILIYARAGRLRGSKEKVDTRALVLEVLELLGAPRGLVMPSERLPTLNVERVLMQQILMNLIGNAIKYTRRVDARITVDCETLEGAWVFSVKDNGPGIAAEHHAKIWEPFQRLQGRDVVEGTGIGLSVVKKIVESRGGAVSVESAQGQGSTFRVRWPRNA